MRMHHFTTSNNTSIWINLDQVQAVKLNAFHQTEILSFVWSFTVNETVTNVLALLEPPPPPPDTYEEDVARIKREGPGELVEVEPTVSILPAAEAMSLALSARITELTDLLRWMDMNPSVGWSGVNLEVRNRIQDRRARKV